MRVTYPGPYEAVMILATGQTVARGDTCDVPAPLGRQLIAQGWTKPAPARKAASATKAAKKNPTKSEED